jgi:hypothetical protein
MPRSKDTKQASIPFSEDGYKLLQKVAAGDSLTINEYVRRLVADDMKRRGIQVGEDELGPGQWGGSRQVKTQAAATPTRPPTIRQVMGFSTRRIARLPVGTLTGVMAPASRRDSYRETASGDWQDADDWQYGKPVHAFNMHRQVPFEVGDVLELDSIDGGPIKYARIDAIKMIDGATITDDDIHLLGYKDRDDWTENGLPARRGWLMTVEMLPGEKENTLKTTRRVEVQDEDGTKKYNINLDPGAAN